MDLITQIQTYVFHLSRAMLQATHEVHQASGSVPPTIDSSTFDSPSIIDKANHIMKLLTEADILMASLPDRVTTEEEQMEQVAKLEQENQTAGERWERAQREAALWQARVSRVLTEAAIKQLHTTTTSNDDTATQEKES